MAIERLDAPTWLSDLGRQIDNPTWDEVEAAIRALDGRDRNDIYLVPRIADPETFLGVGGGGGRYLVTGIIASERFPTVVKELGRGAKRHEGERELLVVGGQEGDYPRRWIIDLETALRAARAFHETGEFGGGEVLWEDV